MTAETWKERKAKGLKKAEWKVLPSKLLVEGTPLEEQEIDPATRLPKGKPSE